MPYRGVLCARNGERSGALWPFGPGQNDCRKTTPCSIGKSRHRRRTRPPHVRTKRRPRCGEDGEQRGRGDDPRWARGGAKPLTASCTAYPTYALGAPPIAAKRTKSGRTYCPSPSEGGSRGVPRGAPALTLPASRLLARKARRRPANPRGKRAEGRAIGLPAGFPVGRARRRAFGGE
jgi:hypothetical protein